MIIEADSNEMVKLFGEYTKLSMSEPMIINGVAFTLEGYDSWTDYGFHGPKTTYKLYLQPIIKPKSPQQIAAEEAVQKAESALKAAKDVLKTVKEK